MPTALTQLAKQLLNIWKQLGVNQRVSVVLATVGLVIGLVALTFWSNRTDYALLYGRLDESEASKVIAALDEAKVPYQIGSNGKSIKVPVDKVYAMRMQLAGKGIPKGDGVGFEIFDKPNFGISDFVQRANYTRALQGELARTISQLDEVESARVMVVLPENRLLGSNRDTTASVFIRVKGNSALSSEAVHSIRFLVANSVEGLQANHVSVVDNRGTVLAENTQDDSFVGMTSGQLAARQKMEHYLTSKAQTMLEKVLGAGQAVVRVAVEINTETVNRTEEKYDPKGSVPRVTTLNEETNESTISNNSAAPGVTANTETNAAPTTTAAAPVITGTKNHKSVANNQFELNKTVSNTTQAPGGVTRISAAVFIASKTTGQGATAKIEPRTTQEIEKLKRVVQSALGLQLGEEGALRKDEITLEEMPFTDLFASENVAQEKQHKQEYWKDLGWKIGYVVIALGIMFMFMRLWKAASAEAAAAAASVEAGGGGLSVENLNRMLREDPAKMTQAVRGWLEEEKGTS